MPIQVHDKTFVPLFSQAEIAAEVSRLGRELNQHYQQAPVTMIVVLKGAFVFAADLLRVCKFPVEIKFVQLSSYHQAMQSSGSITHKGEWEAWELADKHVLVVEDIIDSGITADFLRSSLAAKHPKSLSFVSFLFKPESFQGKNAPEFIGKSISPLFVLGYGMDYAEAGRELGDIYVLAD